MRALTIAALLALACTLAACSSDPCAGRGDMMESPGALEVTEDEHPAGWGSDQCLQCHSLETTHGVGCSSF